MTRKEAIAYCTKRYEDQCERFPRTRELGLALYLARNIKTILKWRNSADYATLQGARR